jgi:hypothetical protein
MFRISLRELLSLVACCALALVSLKYASETWVAAVAALAMLAFFVAIVTALVDRGPRQAFAIGFAVIVVTYGWIVLHTPLSYSGPNAPPTLEFDQWSGRLPTTRLLRYVHQAVDRSQWIDRNGNVIANYNPASHDPSAPGAGSIREIPPREQFMPIGHMWWGLLFGYIGGRFGQFVYARRTTKVEG